jgi:hypothetical protein
MTRLNSVHDSAAIAPAEAALITVGAAAHYMLRL